MNEWVGGEREVEGIGDVVFCLRLRQEQSRATNCAVTSGSRASRQAVVARAEWCYQKDSDMSLAGCRQPLDREQEKQSWAIRDANLATA